MSFRAIYIIKEINTVAQVQREWWISCFVLVEFQYKACVVSDIFASSLPCGSAVANIPHWVLKDKRPI